MRQEYTTTYKYDAFGRRISKQIQTKDKTRRINNSSAKIIKFPVQQHKTEHHHTHYLWDGNRQLQEQTDTHVFTTIYEQDSFEPVARLVWLQDGIEIAANEPVYHDNSHTKSDTNKPPKIQVYHCHNDHLGTPNELTNQDGEVVWLADYEAYGNTAKVVWREEKLESVQVTAEELQPIRFQGQFIDQETGLHYNRFRYYDPDLGMFTTRDPIGLLGGSNVFQYAPNPIGWIDPFGLAVVDAVFTMYNEVFYGTNPLDRSPRVSSPIPGLSAINNDKYKMHAEIDAMTQALDKGLRGGEGVLEVSGKNVCSYCKGDVKKMADMLDLDKLTVIDADGVKYTFDNKDLPPVKKGGKGWKSQANKC